MTDILHCDNPECPKKWGKLSSSGESNIRICTECIKAVYLCENEQESEQRKSAGQLAVIR